MTDAELKSHIPIYRDGNIYMTDAGFEHCVMFGNEIEFIKDSIKEIFKRIPDIKSVVEIGFGFGFTADEFQALGVTEHILIEPNDYIFEQAKKWAVGKHGVTLINERHQNVKTTDIAPVDLIYDDIYELVVPTERERYCWHLRSKWYAEFCTPDPSITNQNIIIDNHYFKFTAGQHKKIQLLERNDIVENI